MRKLRQRPYSGAAELFYGCLWMVYAAGIENRLRDCERDCFDPLFFLSGLDQYRSNHFVFTA